METIINNLYLELIKYSKSLGIIDYEDLVQETLLNALIINNYDKHLCFDVLKKKHIDNYRHSERVRNYLADIREYINPNQEDLVALKQSEKLPNFDLAFKYAIGYKMHELGTASVVHKKLKDFYNANRM